MTHWKIFSHDTPEVNKRFVAIQSDGSGANLFCKTPKGVFDRDGENYGHENNFYESGYFYWTYLPENQKLWFEMKGGEK
jgi:hypothetical protein